ncbi:MAG: hypothetical protein GY705_06040 [Bacteroidetes bacterium]|nr:hypothetical protein [Bacteroidota bacterium]
MKFSEPTMSSLTKRKRISFSKRVFVSLIAAFPFIFLQLAFLKDSYQWSVYLFGYMGIISVAVIVFLGWCVYCFAEYRLRLKNNIRSFPSFSLLGGILLLAFFLPAIVVNPIALNIPSLCRVTQSIEWPTSKLYKERKSNHSFILVLIGKGSKDNHKFTTGYMNWTGKEPAGFTSINLNSISFQERYYKDNISGNKEYLRTRMANSGTPDEELEKIATDVWNLLSLAENEMDLHSKIGDISNIYSHVDDEWDYIIGGIIWILITLFVFIYMGRRTIRFKE